MGFSVAAFIFLLFGLPFFGMGAFVFTLLLSGAHVSGNIAFGYLVTAVFMVVGLSILFLGIAAIRGRQVIEEEGRTISCSLLLFGKRLRPRRMLKREVEDVSV